MGKWRENRKGRSYTTGYGREESKLGGKKKEMGREQERTGREVPDFKFFYFLFSFSFGWLRFNMFHPIVEKTSRHDTSEGTLKFSLEKLNSVRKRREIFLLREHVDHIRNGATIVVLEASKAKKKRLHH